MSVKGAETRVHVEQVVCVQYDSVYYQMWSENCNLRFASCKGNDVGSIFRGVDVGRRKIAEISRL